MYRTEVSFLQRKFSRKTASVPLIWTAQHPGNDCADAIPDKLVPDSTYRRYDCGRPDDPTRYPEELMLDPGTLYGDAWRLLIGDDEGTKPKE